MRLVSPAASSSPRSAAFIRAGGHQPRQQPVVGHAVQHDQAAAVEPALGHRIAAPGGHVRIEPGGPLGDGDLVRPDRVPGARGRQRVGDQVQHASRYPLGRPPDAAPAAQFMIVNRNGRYLPETTRDHGLALEGGHRAGQERVLGGEDRAQLPGPAAACPVERPEGLGELSLLPGQARGEPGLCTVCSGQPVQGGGRRGRLVRRQGEGGQPPGRGGQGGQRRVPLPRAPQHRRRAVRPGEAEPSAQRGGQRPPGQQQCPDRVGGRVPPADRGGEDEGAGRRARAGQAGAQARARARSARNGRRHGGGW